MMEINFTLTPEDTSAFYRDYVLYRKQSKSEQTSRVWSANIRYYMAFFGVPFGIFCVVGLLTGSSDIAAVVWIIAAIGWRPLLDWIWKRRSLDKFSSTPHFLEQHCVRILPEGLFDRTSHMEWTIFWPGIKDIALMESTIFFLTDAGNTSLVPTRVFSTADETNQFFNDSVMAWKSSTWPPSPVRET